MDVMCDKKRWAVCVEGGTPLQGAVTVSGAKNAALPELAALLLGQGEIHLANVPGVADVKALIGALDHLGVSAEREGEGGMAFGVPEHLPGSVIIPHELVESTRASLLLLGPLLARGQRVLVGAPGGCPIGKRGYHFHLQGLEAMGATVREDLRGRTIHAEPPPGGLRGVRFLFPGKTVTGTENLLMAAALAKGTTVLENCALEPEVEDLGRMINGLGGRVQGLGTGTLTIQGVDRLGSGSHRVMTDRIELGTFAVLGSFPGNRIDLPLEGVEAIASLLGVLEGMGVHMERKGAFLRVEGKGGLLPSRVVTEPYPGFPTDLQAQLTALMTQADGVSAVEETIFENRFQHVPELCRMGARIEVSGREVRVMGPSSLKGAEMMASDLRASAALVLAGLVAKGTSRIENACQLLRGYERLPEKISALGGRIRMTE